jgi:hypothetical protein
MNPTRNLRGDSKVNQIFVRVRVKEMATIYKRKSKDFLSRTIDPVRFKYGTSTKNAYISINFSPCDIPTQGGMLSGFHAR